MTTKLAPPPPPAHLLRAPPPPPHLIHTCNWCAPGETGPCVCREAPPPPAHLLRAPPPPPHLIHDHSLTTLILQAMDTECYRNYWLIKFYDPRNGMTREFEQFPGQALDIAGVLAELKRSTSITFNGNHYDLPMIAYALSGADCNALKEANDLIIKGGLKPWDFYKHFRIDELDIDTIDVKEVAPGVNVSLKTYGGRGHSRKLQDLPIKPDMLITPDQRRLLSLYCTNDLITTWELYQRCIKAIELRVRMTLKYGVDLRSKSDAQIAEALFKKMLGFKPAKAYWPHMTPFQYKAPAFIKFVTKQMQDTLDYLHGLTFYSSDKDQTEDEVDAFGDKVKTGIIRPASLKKLKIQIGESFYKLGIGGLHSMESARYHISDTLAKLSDHDVNSYYPSLILICGMYPTQLGERFIEIYREVYEERLAAKALAGAIAKAIKQAKADGLLSLSKLEEDFLIATAEADAKKIILNGTFGKLGSKWSIFFAPDLLLQVTLTGQLSLLMLIESLELSAIPVVSANTDGIVIKCPVGMEWLRDNLIKSWEGATGLTTEATEYAALYSRDINNYLAFKYDGTYKAKGVFAKAGIAKNPTNSIVVEAVADYLGKSKAIQTTINECQDITKFLTIRNVKGGGVKEVRGPVPIHHSMEQLVTMAGYVEEFEGWKHNTWNMGDAGVGFISLKEAYAAAVVSTPPVISRDYLGKVVRWYYGKDHAGFISYETNGNKVPKSEGAVPLMDLPDTFPGDLDRSRYVEEAKEMLGTLGVAMV